MVCLSCNSLQSGYSWTSLSADNDLFYLQALEGCWLDGSAFVAGHEVSIADLLVITELEMLRLLAASPEVCLSRRPGLT